MPDPIPAPLALAALRFALSAAPKVDDNSALSCLVLDGEHLVACDEYAWHRAALGERIAASRVKVTRASAAGLARLLDGAIKAGKERSLQVTVEWSGLIARIVTESPVDDDASAPIAYELDAHVAGPVPEVFVEVGDAVLGEVDHDAHVVLPTDRLVAALGWSMPDAETTTHVHRDIDNRTRFDTVWGDCVVATAIVAAPTYRIELRQLPLFPAGAAATRDAIRKAKAAGIDTTKPPVRSRAGKPREAQP